MVRDRQLLIRLEHETRESLKERVKDYDSRRDVGTVLYEIVSRIADGSLPLSVALGEDSAIPEQAVIEEILSRLDALESKLNDSNAIAVSNDDAEPVNYFPDVADSEGLTEKKVRAGRLAMPKTLPVAPIKQPELGLNSAELAALTGISESTIQKWWRKTAPGESPRSRDYKQAQEWVIRMVDDNKRWFRRE